MASKTNSGSDVDHVDNISHGVTQGEAPKGSDLPWWQQSELRKLYGMMVFLFLGSTTLGYDGSLLNGLQTMDSWRNCAYLQASIPHPP